MISRWRPVSPVAFFMVYVANVAKTFGRDRFEYLFEIIKATWSDFNVDKCIRIAAPLAYYAAFSLAPVMILILRVGRLAFEPEDLRGRVRTEVENVVGTAGADQIEMMLDTNVDVRQAPVPRRHHGSQLHPLSTRVLANHS